ncbi:MAG: DUF2333 family protein [Proteobacteria bacterium]|nr:MAG: DUF2333 family protein [Pseudomonadota bacterium]
MINFITKIMGHPDFPQRAKRISAVAVSGITVLVICLMLVFDHEPDSFSVLDRAVDRAGDLEQARITGYVATATLIEIIDTLLGKRGGYLSNDISPPGVLMDNTPNWEWGVLVQVRDMVTVFRNDFSRSQSQSTENPDLIEADNRIRIDSEKWMFPAAEGEYRLAAKALSRYLVGLGMVTETGTQFFARADNLHTWLALVGKRLGDLSQRLGASVGQVRVNTDLAGDAYAEQSTDAPSVVVVKTPRLQVDDVFYEARGGTWALIHLLRAVEYDFAAVLEKKNALVSLRQIIRELEGCQEAIWSPIILNGRGFGFLANHSLVMASYISRANAAVIDLRSLLERG